MKSGTTNVQKHFDSVSKQWDAIYSNENRLMSLLNRWFRKGLYERYRLTFEHCGDLNGKRILDIGCGTGRYSIECAKRGAAYVVGIDFAASMIKFSQEMAHQMKVADKCKFICGDVISYPFEKSFDIVLALGFFDYIKEPEPIFRKIAELKPHIFAASFPKYSPIWDIQRKIRYRWIKKCEIYNYSAEQLNNLAKNAKFTHHQIIPCKSGYFLIAGM
ncbi:MAG: class I SAM-dependent methyltransferase [Sedimentisphaerales bacterium]